jgi:hypothetical protein
MTDIDGNGEISLTEWRNFYDMFVEKFNNSDSNGDLLIDESEFNKSFSDLKELSPVIND